MDKNELIKQIDKAYRELQCINVQPTKANIAILMSVMSVFENIYSYLKNENASEAEPEVTIDGE